MTSASLRPWALPCLLLLLLAFPRAASGGGMGVSAPPCGVTADSNGVNQSDPPHTYDLPFHYYRVPFGRAPHANRDLELMWSDTYLSRYGKRLDTLGPDGLTDLDRLGISACDTEHNPIGMPWTDIRLMYNFLADQRTLRDSTGALVPRAGEYDTDENHSVGFQDCQTDDPEVERSHFDLYLYVPAFQQGHGYASYLGDGSDGEHQIPNYGLWKSTYHWATEDSTTVLDETVYEGNSIQITGPRPWEVGATDAMRWTRSSGLANSQIMHEGLHALNNGGSLHMRASAAEMITGWCDDAPQDDVDYHYSLSPASGNISNAYAHWQSFSAWLAFNWRGDPAPGAWQDDLLARWSKAPPWQQSLFFLGQRLRDSECAQCVDYPGFAGLDGTARVQKLLHDWRVACYVNNPNLPGGYYGFPSEPAFSPANDLGAWQNVDHATFDDGFAVPPVIHFGADDLNRPRWFTERPAGPGFNARPLRMSMFGAEYFVVRADSGLAGGKHLIVEARPDPLRYANNPYATCQPILISQTGRLFASVVTYSQSADSLFRHPEWATSVTTQSVVLDSVGREIAFDIPDFGGVTKAALVVLTLEDGPEGSYTGGGYTTVQDSLAVALGLTVWDGASPRPTHGVTTTAAVESEPAWSPDGATLVYRALDESGTARIYLRPSDGSGSPTPLRSASLGQLEPDWSPRGDRVAYVEGKQAFGQGDSILRQIWLVNPATGSPQQLSHLAGVAHAPAFSPNGSEVAYLRELIQGGNYYWEVRRVNVATGSDQLVISYSGPTWMYGLRWAPDARELTYSRYDVSNGQYHMHRLKLGDSAPVSLDAFAPQAKAWAFSPGRGPLLVEDLRGWPIWQTCDPSNCPGCQVSTFWLSAHRVALLDTLTSTWTPIEYRTGAEFSLPRWSPDGTKVAYVTTQNGNPDVYVAATTFNRAPTFTSLQASYSVPSCDAWVMSLAATDPDGGALTYEVFDLPAGAVLQSGNQLRWEYPVVGQHWLIARALDPQGAVASKVVLLDVYAGGPCGGGGGEEDPDPIIPGGNATRHTDGARLIGGGSGGPARLASTFLDGAASGIWTSQTARLVAARSDSAGQVRTRVAALRPGTFALDRARLLVVDHAPGTVAVATPLGLAVGAKHRAAHMAVAGGEDLTQALRGETADARLFPAGSTLALEWAPADSIAGVILGCARASAADGTSEWGVRLEVPQGGGWSLAGRIHPRSSYDALAAPLPVGTAARLVFASDTYVREVAGYSLGETEGGAATVTPVELSGTDAESGVEHLALADSAAVELSQGEGVTLLFDGPPPVAERQRTLFLDLVASFTPEGVAGSASQAVAEAPPLSFALHANRPNPFGGGTTIRFDVPRTSAIRLEVFDAQGRRIRTLADGAFEPGRHALAWDGRDSDGQRARPGVYLYRLTTNGFRDQRRMVLLGR